MTVFTADIPGTIMRQSRTISLPCTHRLPYCSLTLSLLAPLLPHPLSIPPCRFNLPFPIRIWESLREEGRWGEENADVKRTSCYRRWRGTYKSAVGQHHHDDENMDCHLEVKNVWGRGQCKRDTSPRSERHDIWIKIFWENFFIQHVMLSAAVLTGLVIMLSSYLVDWWMQQVNFLSLLVSSIYKLK